LPGFAPIATLTFPVKPAAVFPWASWAVTCNAGVMAAPDVVLVGCTVTTSRAAEPGVIVNALLVAAATPPPEAARVYTAPTLSMLRPGNVATPFTAATVAVPESVPPPGLAP